LIGWRKDSHPTGEPTYIGFWKYFVSGEEWDGGFFTANCCATRRFKIFKVPSVNVYELRYDNNNDGIFETFVDQVQTLTFPNGLASGETGRRGGSGTNAYDHFIDLKRTTSTAGDTGWTAWSGNIWWKDCIPGWGWDWMLQNEYQILGVIPCN
jgi:hypothetical protein